MPSCVSTTSGLASNHNKGDLGETSSVSSSLTPLWSASFCFASTLEIVLPSASSSSELEYSDDDDAVPLRE